MKTSTLYSSIAAGLFALALVAGPSMAQSATQPTTPSAPSTTDKAPHAKDGKQKDGQHKKDDKAAEKSDASAKVGDAAPAFKLTSSDGKEVGLADFKGKIVVLEWFNPECPFILKHHKKNSTFNDLAKKYAGKDVVILAINSTAAGQPGNGKEANAKAKTDFKMEYPILLDEKGTVGRAYGAKTTPHCFVIDAKGVLAYSGAIDDDKSMETAGKVNYVGKAVDELLAKQSVSTATTQPYGCKVHY